MADESTKTSSAEITLDERGGQVAAGALETVSDSLDLAGEAARRGGMAIRDRFRDSARAVERGEQVLKADGVSGAADAVGRSVQRNKGVLAGAAGVLAAGALALKLARRASDGDA